MSDRDDEFNESLPWLRRTFPNQAYRLIFVVVCLIAVTSLMVASFFAPNSGCSVQIGEDTTIATTSTVG